MNDIKGTVRRQSDTRRYETTHTKGTNQRYVSILLHTCRICTIYMWSSSSLVVQIRQVLYYELGHMFGFMDVPSLPIIFQPPNYW
mmetsp:Transcript_40650/g.45412  ORF Transcript_40650/g.45412 Transcript_40650/m.45412 type:complete len:85 (-) Transcript_40650:356-610(-)